MDSLAIQLANGTNGPASDLAYGGDIGIEQTSRSLRGEQWGYLQWTRKEVESIEPLLSGNGFQAQLKTGFEATEEALRSLGAGRTSPRILHLATHGFFFPDPEINNQYVATLPEVKEQSDDSGPAVAELEPAFKLSDHPMIRSGLILAGGNYAWQGNPRHRKYGRRHPHGLRNQSNGLIKHGNW